ncbi:hypothetical protein [Candidatus Parabeggiatoa sp. HSG14]|uniref:hypothetical protein n=1 Tax=Candidatus Parabeggiatoa sp. HSG14 TaxID=3055593 RepID=UPI0025A88CE7|nr:hypothetical protein [Thiotrichales bacterium HSG14]
MLKLQKLLVILAVGLFSQTALAETFTVVSGSSQYKKGQVLSGKTKIKLKAGEKLVIKTVRTDKEYRYILKGPYSEDSKEKGLLETIIEIIKPQKGGAANQANEQVKNPWLLIVSQDYNFCYHTNDSIKFWRAKAPKDAEITIEGITTDKPFEEFWEADNHDFEVDVNKLPKVKKGGIYLAKIEGTFPITLHKMPSSLSSDTYKANWMFQKGCKRQGMLLLKEEKLLLTSK